MSKIPACMSHWTWTSRETREVHVTLEARETAWEITQETVVPAWGYGGTIVSCVISHEVSRASSVT